MEKLFEQFLREKTYLANLQPRTLDIYQQTFNRYFKGMETTKTSVQECVVKMFRPQSGVTGIHLIVIYAIIAFALVVYFAFVFGRVANLKAEITEKKKLLEMKAGDKVR